MTKSNYTGNKRGHKNKSTSENQRGYPVRMRDVSFRIILHTVGEQLEMTSAAPAKFILSDIYVLRSKVVGVMSRFLYDS